MKHLNMQRKPSSTLLTQVCLESRKYARGSEIRKEIADKAECDRTWTVTDKMEHI